MKFKRILQLFFSKIFAHPELGDGKSVGYSFVKSECFDFISGINTNVVAPFFMHHVKLGDYSYISSNCHISNIDIGKFCSIGPNFCCGLGIHPTNGISTSPMFYSTAKQNGISLCNVNIFQESKKTRIGNDVFIGANVTVLDGVTIGDGAVIGAGAVVVSDVPPYAIAVGVPAEVKKYRFSYEQIEKFLSLKWWDWNEEELYKVEKRFWNIDEFLNENLNNNY